LALTSLVIQHHTAQVRVIPCFGTASPLRSEFCLNIRAPLTVTLKFTLRLRCLEQSRVVFRDEVVTIVSFVIHIITLSMLFLCSGGCGFHLVTRTHCTLLQTHFQFIGPGIPTDFVIGKGALETAFLEAVSFLM